VVGDDEQRRLLRGGEIQRRGLAVTQFRVVAGHVHGWVQQEHAPIRIVDGLQGEQSGGALKLFEGEDGQRLEPQRRLDEGKPSHRRKSISDWGRTFAVTARAAL
jgi:hypothetical protein